MRTHDETTARARYVPVPDGQAAFDFSALPDMPATEKQRRYIAVLMDQIGWHSEQLAAYAGEQGIDLVAMTKKQATAFIDGLKRLAEPQSPTGPAPRVAGDELFPEDDAPPLIPTLQQITCRVCGLVAKVRVGQANLCHACAADLLITRQHVEQALETSAASLDTAAQTWLDAQAAADDATLDRWHKAEAYIKQGRETDPAFRATWERERSAQTPLGTLLCAYEAYTAADAAAREIRTWGQRAMVEIEAAEGARPAPRPNEYAVPDDATPVACRSCGAAMVWVKTPAGKPLPLSVATIEARDGVRYALPHFADCPEAKDWSRKP